MNKTAVTLSLFAFALGAPAAGEDLVSLKTSRSTLSFDRARRGAVVSFVDTATGAEFVNGKAAQDLFAIAWSRPDDTSGKLERWTGRDAEQVEWAVNDAGATAVFKRLGGNDVTVTCTASVSPDRDDIRWSLRITGAAPMRLEGVDFPILELRAPLADGGEADAVVAGLTKGGVYRDPSKWKPGAGLDASQPGRLAAQFGCYYSERAGLLSYSRDDRGFPKVLDIRRTQDGLRWTWKRRCYQPVAEPFELGYEISLTTFTGREPGEPADWRDAADIYKRWAIQQPWCAAPYAERPDIPGWMKQGPAMIRFSRDWLGKPERVEGWLSDYWRKQFPETPLVVALWGWEQVGSWVSPKYFPPYPSEAGFSRVVKAATSAGGHPFPWPSGYYWNVEYREKPDGSFEWEDWDDFNATGLPHALRQRDGSPLIRKLPWLDGGRNAVLCRGDQWTRQWFNDNAVKLMERGCDMVQVDQVVGGLAPGNGECFSAGHGHPPGPGVWDAEAFAAQLRSLAAECRRVQPDAVLAIEEPQELFNHLIGIQDYRDAQGDRWPALPGMAPASIFGYLYHEFLPVFQSNPRAGDLPMLAYCAVTGQIPHWVPHWPVTPSPVLTNGGFEEWTGDVPDGWERVKGWQGREFPGRAFRDDGEKAGGQASLRLENGSGSDIVQISQNVPVGPGRLQIGGLCRLRVRAKTERLERENAIGIAALTTKLDSKGSWRIPFPAPGDWTEGSVEFTIPDQTDFLRIMIHVNGPCRLRVDDLELEEETPEGAWRPLMKKGVPPEHEFVRRWVGLFHGEGRPYLLLGEMIRPPKLLDPVPAAEERSPFPPVMVNAFRAADNSEAAVIANATGREREVRFEWRGEKRTLVMPAWDLRLVR